MIYMASFAYIPYTIVYIQPMDTHLYILHPVERVYLYVTSIHLLLG